MSDEQKEKVRLYSSGCHWYNNGKVSVFSKVCPPGFSVGRIVTEKLLASNRVNAKKNKKE